MARQETDHKHTGRRRGASLTETTHVKVDEGKGFSASTTYVYSPQKPRETGKKTHIFYIAHGNGVFSIEGGEHLSAQAGDCVTIEPGSKYRFTGSMKFFCVKALLLKKN